MIMIWEKIILLAITVGFSLLKKVVMTFQKILVEFAGILFLQ